MRVRDLEHAAVVVDHAGDKDRDPESRRKRRWQTDPGRRPTVRIERAQMESHDQTELEKFLDEVTRIKLEALDELTHEDLRGDRMFQIFLMQCANLISKIQAKMSQVES